MNIVFRVDASLIMGAGHVMRCLTLARALRERGHTCSFISREHAGNLNSMISGQGFYTYCLPIESSQDHDLFHSSWLNATQERDAEISRQFFSCLEPDWIVVDHYSLDHRWERAAKPDGCLIMVIDDLADRAHHCDLLLDQNLGKQVSHYQNLVPEGCVVLAGPRNALLRPEFSLLRMESLERRHSGRVHKILVALGGVDVENCTGAILEALRQCEIPETLEFVVVMGPTAPHLDTVKAIASGSPWPVTVLCGISDMAERMAAADLAIGAGGGTSWERCCLGLPTLLVVLAENQVFASNALRDIGAVDLINSSLPLAPQLCSAFSRLQSPDVLSAMSVAAANVCDGGGVENLIKLMENFTVERRA